GGLRLALVHHHHAWPRPDRPLVLVDVVDRLVVHQEQRVTEGLAAGLETVGYRADLVIAHWLPADEQDALAALPADDEAGFDNLWKYQDAAGRPGHGGRLERP